MGEKKKIQQTNGGSHHHNGMENKGEGDENLLSNMNHQLKGIKQKTKRFKDLHDKVFERDQYVIQPKKTAPITPGDVSKMIDSKPSFVEDVNPKEVLAALEFLQTTVSTLEEFYSNFQKYYDQTSARMSKQMELQNSLQEENTKQKKIIDLKESDLTDTKVQLRLYKQKYDDVNEQNKHNNDLVAQLKTEVNQLKKTVEEMRSSNSAYSTIDKLNAHIDSQDVQIAEKDREITDLNEIIESLRLEIDEMKQSAEDAVKPTAPTEAAIIQTIESSAGLPLVEERQEEPPHSMLIQQLQQQLTQYQIAIQQQNLLISKKDLFIKQLEEQNHLSMGISSEMFEVLLEEEFVNNYRGVNIEATLKDVLRVVQIIDFFDLSKPDGLDIRNMFLSDQTNMLNSGNNILIGSFSDFNAFDHFARVIRGNSSSKIPEEAIAQAISYMKKFLEKSDELCFGSVSFKHLTEHFDELGSSSIFLNNKSVYPLSMQPQQQLLPKLSVEMLLPQAITQVEIPLSVAQLNLETNLSNSSPQEQTNQVDLNSVNNVIDGISLSIRKPPFDDEIVEQQKASSSGKVVQENSSEQVIPTKSQILESEPKQHKKQPRNKSPQQQATQNQSQPHPRQHYQRKRNQQRYKYVEQDAS